MGNRRAETQYRDIAWAELQCDVYDVKTEKTKSWYAYVDGDMDGDSDTGPFVVYVQHHPPGTKIVVSVPLCPKCGQDRSDCEEEQRNRDPADSDIDDCAFNWKMWDEERFG